MTNTTETTSKENVTVETFDVDKNAIGVKQHTPKSKSTKTTVKPVKKETKATLASKFDELLVKGGTWESLITKATEAVKELKLTTKISKGSLKAHVAYRVKKNPQYLGKLKMTDTGISLPKTKK